MIPEKWILKLTKESIPILSKWIKKEFDTDYYTEEKLNDNWSHFGFPNFSNLSGFKISYHLMKYDDRDLEKYTEISLEEFKQYIYKTEGSIVENFQIY